MDKKDVNNKQENKTKSDKNISFSNNKKCTFLEKIFLCNPFRKSLQISVTCTCINDVPIEHNYLEDSFKLKFDLHCLCIFKTT